MVALNMPKIALAPLIIVWLGLGMQSKNAIVAPESLAWIVAAFRLNIGFALIGAVVGEYISAERRLV